LHHRGPKKGPAGRKSRKSERSYRANNSKTVFFESFVTHPTTPVRDISGEKYLGEGIKAKNKWERIRYCVEIQSFVLKEIGAKNPRRRKGNLEGD